MACDMRGAGRRLRRRGRFQVLGFKEAGQQASAGRMLAAHHPLLTAAARGLPALPAAGGLEEFLDLGLVEFVVGEGAGAALELELGEEHGQRVAHGMRVGQIAGGERGRLLRLTAGKRRKRDGGHGKAPAAPV